MNGQSITLLHSKDLQEIDRRCEQFEKQWKQGNAPDIERFLDGAKGSFCAALLTELVLLDIDYRTRAGQRPEPAEYEIRFAENLPSISEAFAGGQQFTFNSLHAADAIDDFREILAHAQPPFQELNLVSHYKMTRFHARGGLGEVYLATDERLNRPVAIKVPRNRKPDSAAHARLIREAEITSFLKHPGIIPVYATSGRVAGNPFHNELCKDSSFGESADDSINQESADDGCKLPFYIMPFVEGQTFRSAIDEFHEQFANHPADRFESRQFRRLLQRLISVCNTVAYAHDQGIIHRDIKPDNIMLGQFGETFLLDWGLAKVLDETEAMDESLLSLQSGDQFGDDSSASRVSNNDSGKPGNSQQSRRTIRERADAPTLPGRPVGTLNYASPEQIQGLIEKHGPRSDVYSIGATLYYLLSEEHPEQSTEHSPHRHGCSWDVNIPRDLQAVCEKAMQPELAHRYSDVQSLSEDLECFLADKPVSVRRPPWSVRCRRWIGENSRLASGLASGLLVALIGLMIGSAMLGNKNRQLGDSIGALQKTNIKLKDSRDATHAANENTMQTLRALTQRAMMDFTARRESLGDDDVQFLNQLLARFQTHARSLDDETQSRSIEMETNYNIGKIQKLLGDKAACLKSWQDAIRISQPLPMDATPEYRDLAIRIHGDYGQLASIFGKSSAGIEATKWSLDELIRLIADFPDEERFKNRMPVSRAMFAHTLLAEQKFQPALEQFRTIADGTANSDLAADDWEALHFQGQTRCNIGFALFHLNRFTEAIAELEKAAAILEALVRDGKTTRDIMHDRIKTSQNHALALVHLKELDSSAAKFDVAFERSQELVDLYPNVLAYQQTWISIQLDRLELLLKQGEKIRAIAESQQVMQRAKDAGIPSKQDVSSRHLFARVLNLQGNVCWATNRRQQAIKKFDLAISFLEETSQPQRDDPRLKSILRHVTRQVAVKLMSVDRMQDTMDYWDRLIRHSDEHEVASFRALRAVCLAQLDPQTTLEEVESISDLVLANTYAGKDKVLFNLACAAARAGSILEPEDQRADALTLAIRQLEQANEHGFLKSPARRRKFLANPSFKWMHDDDRFKRLIPDR